MGGPCRKGKTLLRLEGSLISIAHRREKLASHSENRWASDHRSTKRNRRARLWQAIRDGEPLMRRRRAAVSGSCRCRPCKAAEAWRKQFQQQLECKYYL